MEPSELDAYARIARRIDDQFYREIEAWVIDEYYTPHQVS